MSDSLEGLAQQLAQKAVEELWSRLSAHGVPITPAWLSPKQAAVYTCFSTVALEQFRRLGTGAKWSKVNGKSVRYQRSDLDAWLLSGAVTAKPPSEAP